MGLHISKLTAEQQTIVQQHLSSQEDLVRQLQSVVDQQARALSALDDMPDDYASDGEVSEQGSESGAEEIGALKEAAKAAEMKQVEPDIDDAEAGEPDVDYVEPTEEEERSFQATKPWLGAMAPPTSWRKDPAWDSKPDVALDLEYVYGYRARTCRNNVFWVSSGDRDAGPKVTYFAAAVGIVHDVAANTQQFFLGHDDDIISMDYHSQRRIVATGQQGRTPPICVWEVDGCEQVACLKGYHKRAVVAIAISPDGSKIASVGLDDNHSIAIYDWQTETLMVECKGDTARILEIAWNGTGGVDPNDAFVTVGVKHIKFWATDGGRLKAKRGKLGKRGKRQVFLAATFTDQHTLIGTRDGSIYTFKGDKLYKSTQAHTGMITCMRHDGEYCYTGGKDGFLNVWDLGFKKKRSINMNKYDPGEARNMVRAVDFTGPADNGELAQKKLLVGTITSTIYCIPMSTGEPSVIQQGHFGDLSAKEAYGELWGLAPTPGAHLFASVCDDKTLRLWNVDERRMVTRCEMDVQARSCAYSPDGRLFAVGFQNGTFAIYDTDTWSEEISKKKRKRRIPVVKFSPCGAYLAVGSADNYVDLYDVQTWRRIGVCKGNSSVILHLDWSKDSEYIQTVSQAYELLFYKGQSGEHYTRSRQLKDVQWATQECTLGWNVQGIWPKFSDGSDVNMVNRSNSEKYLVSCEDSGLVKLFNYPCIGSGLDRRGKLLRRPQAFRGMGHSSHVTNANFLSDDSYVLSTGGADLSIFQWRVVAAQ